MHICNHPSDLRISITSFIIFLTALTWQFGPKCGNCCCKSIKNCSTYFSRFFPNHLGMATFAITKGLILTLPVPFTVRATVILSLERFTLFTLLVASVVLGSLHTVVAIPGFTILTLEHAIQ